ncbi:MAG: insulinase family protein [Alphaproteobacteria bacterium]|nr:insulinase family protein [Alphaproteobacteria bacterium]
MSVQVTTLANGLRIATDTMPEAQSAVIGAWVGVGARHEPWHANGIAHFTEHMLFKGTKRRSAYALSASIEKNGGSMNAHTTREETAYYARVLPEDIERAADVIADMLMRSIFEDHELDLERQVVIQEIGRDRDTPDEYIYDLAHAAAFPRQKIGRAILGTEDVIERLARERMVDYVKKNYHAGNIVLIGTGRITHDELVALGRRYFSRLPNGRAAKAEPARIRKGDCREEKDCEQLHVLMSFPAPSHHGRKSHVATLLGNLLGGSATSRLFQKVRERKGLVYNISTYHMPFQDTGLFCLYAGTDPARIKELIPVVCKELKEVSARVTPTELRRAKAQARAETLMNQESVMRRAEMLGQNMLTFGRPIATQTMIDQIMSVTTEEMQDMARKIFSRPPVIAALGQTSHMEPYSEIASRMGH